MSMINVCSAQGVVLLGAAFLAGCSDPQSACTYPAFFAQAPAAQVETLTRVCGWPKRRIVAASAETGDIWPGKPDHVPTMLDVQAEAARAGVKPTALPRPRDNGLCRPGLHGEAPRGVALGVC